MLQRFYLYFYFMCSFAQFVSCLFVFFNFDVRLSEEKLEFMEVLWLKVTD